MSFENAWILYILCFLPALGLLVFYYLKWRNKILSILTNDSNPGQSLKIISVAREILLSSLVIFGIGFLVVSLANPQKGTSPVKMKRSGTDLVIALDLSRSMDAEDIQPDRLSRAKLFLNQLIDDLNGNRVALVVFAGRAYIQVPLTEDVAALKMMLNSISTDMAPYQGTAIADAILRSQRVLSAPGTPGSKAIVIISDGETHDEDAIRQAEEAKKNGLGIYTVGIGTEKGAPVPIHENGQLTGLEKDKDGNTIISVLDEKLLKDVANAGKGYYYNALKDPEAEKSLASKLKNLSKTEREISIFRDYDSKYQYFLSAGLALFLLEMGIRLFPVKTTKAADEV